MTASASTAQLPKSAAYLIFALVLVAYTVQCELASYLNRVGYAKPFFLLYLTHSSYWIIGFFHYAALKLLNVPLKPLMHELRDAVASQLHAEDGQRPSRVTRFPIEKAMKRQLALTVLIALPAGMWYSAIPFANMTSLTALYNLSAFWAYVLSIYYSKQEKWEVRSALAVGLACFGVLVMTWGDSKEDSEAYDSLSSLSERGEFSVEFPTDEPPAQGQHLFGDFLGLLSSFACGFYEVWYKKYIALPTPSHAADGEDGGSGTTSDSSLQLARRKDYSKLAAEADEDEAAYERRRLSNIAEVPEEEDGDLEHEGNALERELAMTADYEHSTVQAPSAALFLLHANLITGSIGISTMLLFWMPIPFLHWAGYEKFELPPDLQAYAAVGTVMFCGVIFNAGFMCLISLWGATIASVGNLATLVLVAASDEVIALMNGYSALSFSTLLGSALILVSFGMLIGQSGH